MSEKRKRKSKTGSFILSFISSVLITSLMLSAVVFGVYLGREYVRPHSEQIVNNLQIDTLEYTSIENEKCNILIMGVDKEGLRTDVLMLAQIDPIKNTATVMSIPRDTRVKYKGGHHKINEVHALGLNRLKSSADDSEKEAAKIEASILAVKELTGVPIHHFVKINFKAFRDCIDELGGVDFDVPQRMKYSDPYQDLYINLQPGMQHLDGDKSEQLVRFRRYKNGDLDRIKVQQDFMQALLDQKLKAKYISKVDDVYEIIMDNMETSMSTSDMVDCAELLLDIGTGNITPVTMPGTPDYVGAVSYVIVDKDGLKDMVEECFGYVEDGNEVEAKTEDKK